MGDAADEARERWESGDYDEDDGDGIPNDRDRERGVSFARRAPGDPPPVNVGPARAIAESAAGLRVVREGHAPEWMPRRFVDAASQVKRHGDAGDLIVTAWIAQQKGWHAVGASASTEPRRVLSVSSATVILEFTEGAWTRESLLAELQRLAGVRRIEIESALSHHTISET